MSGVTFVCPKCNQSLECDDSVRGQVVECPSCKTQITVPSGQQKKQIILPKPSSPATPTPTSAPPPKANTGKVGLVVALVIGLVIGLIIGYGGGSAKGTSSTSHSISSGVPVGILGPSEAEVRQMCERLYSGSLYEGRTLTQMEFGKMFVSQGGTMEIGCGAPKGTQIFPVRFLLTYREGKRDKKAWILRNPFGEWECHLMN